MVYSLYVINVIHDEKVETKPLKMRISSNTSEEKHLESTTFDTLNYESRKTLCTQIYQLQLFINC